ncbi:MAG: MurR/RpiR family transcriptional regulator [Paracoccaceae bacterium]
MGEHSHNGQSLRDVMAEKSAGFTRSERQLHAVILADYPFAALRPIHELSDISNVSAPSVSRFVAKMGYRGLQEFQQHALKELRDAQSSPIELRQSQPTASGDLVSRYFSSAMALTEELAHRLPREQFDRIVDLLSDPRRRIFVIGGRMSDAIAGFFLRHLQQIRSDVHHIPQDSEVWPEYLLRLRSRDVVLILDFRRYDPRLTMLAKLVRGRGAQSIVVTDTWISPAAKGARELICVPTDSGTLWDSYSAAFILIEALLVPLAEKDWDRTKNRIEAWDRLRMSAETETKS